MSRCFWRAASLPKGMLSRQVKRPVSLKRFEYSKWHGDVLEHAYTYHSHCGGFVPVML